MAENNEDLRQTAHDPWDGPDPGSIKSTDSMFFNDAEKAVMANKQVLDQVEIGKVNIPESPQDQSAFSLLTDALSGTPESKKRLKDFIEQGYPSSYTLVTNSFDRFRLEERTLLVHRMNQLREEMDNEYKVPENIALNVRFHFHAIDNPSEFNTYKNAYKDMVKGNFKKDEKNIYLGESTEPIKGKNRLFEKAYQKYGSYVKASYVVGTYGHNGSIPTDSEVENVTQKITQQVRSFKDPDTAFSVMEKEVIDELVEEGYDIKYIFENGIPWPKDAKEVFDSPRDTPKDQAKYLKLMVPLSVKREKEIVRQVEEIEESATEHTNILLSLGINHQHTLKYGIPLRYVPITRFEIAQESNDRPEVLAVIDELARTGKVSDELVKQAFPES